MFPRMFFSRPDPKFCPGDLLIWTNNGDKHFAVVRNCRYLRLKGDGQKKWYYDCALIGSQKDCIFFKTNLYTAAEEDFTKAPSKMEQLPAAA